MPASFVVVRKNPYYNSLALHLAIAVGMPK